LENFLFTYNLTQQAIARYQDIRDIRDVKGIGDIKGIKDINGIVLWLVHGAGIPRPVGLEAPSPYPSPPGAG